MKNENYQVFFVIGELCFEYQYDVGSRSFVICPIQAVSKKLAEKFPDKYLQTEAYGNAEYIGNIIYVGDCVSDSTDLTKFCR